MKQINGKLFFRRAGIKDLENLCRLREQLAHDPEDKLTTEYAPYSAKRDKIFIEKCLSSRKKLILIAEDKDGICAHNIILIETISPKVQAYYTYHKKALMVHLYVDKNKRRQGIAKDLVNYSLEYLKKQGIEFVDLECYTYNTKASNLYKKLGFQDVFTTKRFYLK